MYKKKAAKKKVVKAVRVKRVPKMRPGKPEIEAIVPGAKPKIVHSPLQLKLMDIVRRQLQRNQIYKLNIESLPTTVVIERMGMEAAAEQLYHTSNYWEQVLR